METVLVSRELVALLCYAFGEAIENTQRAIDLEDESRRDLYEGDIEFMQNLRRKLKELYEY